MFLLDVWNACQPGLQGKQFQGNNENGKESKDESAISIKKTLVSSQEQHNDTEGKCIPAKHTLVNVGVQKTWKFNYSSVSYALEVTSRT